MSDPVETEVVAAGTVPWRRAGDGIEVLLVHRPRYDDWSLPKGHRDPGEPITETAVRETLEEAGVSARIGGRLGHTEYRTPDGAPKVVHYWAAEVLTDHGFTPNKETDDRRWVPPRDAAAMLSYGHDADLVERLGAVGVPESTVLFVRHAKAGSREDWDGDDDLRPLSDTGQAQADGLAEFLPRFGPERVITAPPLRCSQTVDPLVAKLGLETAVEPLMGEHAYWEDEHAGRVRFGEIASVPGVTVVSSQGGVIPDVVEALLLAEQRGGGRGTVAVPDNGVPSHKASTWVLGFAADGEMLFADYYRRPPG